MATVEFLRVEVVYCPNPGAARQAFLHLPSGNTVDDAVQRSGLLQECPELLVSSLAVGVWGKRCTLGTTLRDRDRVEIYRPLQVDPKEARRLRYKSHRTKDTT